jgi:hypothetical protein
VMSVRIIVRAASHASHGPTGPAQTHGSAPHAALQRQTASSGGSAPDIVRRKKAALLDRREDTNENIKRAHTSMQTR